MKRLLLLNLVFMCMLHAVSAQNFNFGDINFAELDMKKYPKDTSAHAVVLNEYGRARITIVNDDKIRLVYEYHVRTKILDDNGVKYGSVEIPLYIGESVEEEISEINAVTIYNDAAGHPKKETLQPGKIYTVKETKRHTTVKFALPNVRAGSIIEYSYKIITPYYEDLRSWQFQDDLPKMHSLYEAFIPAFWSFNALMRGSLKMSRNTADLERECFSSGGAKCDCSHLLFEMNDIPAFVEEEYMTSPKNFISAVYFELAEYQNPYTGTRTKLAKEWTNVDRQLKIDDNFGKQFKRNSFLKEKIGASIAGQPDSLAKAKAVYAYIQKNIKWNEYTSFTSEDIRAAVEKHGGNVGDINLALVAALGAAGINAEAVLLSTRDHGVVNKLYPVITEFNYVIAKANIGGKSYLLDATDPLLSFGMLPLRCLNDQGRVMSLDKPSYWIDMDTKQTENNTYVFDLTLQKNGKLTGTLSSYSFGYAAYLKRRAIKKFNTVDEYVDDLDGKLPKFKITKSAIHNLDSLDSPVEELYEVEIDAYNELNGNKVKFNPFLFDRIETNPFKLTERAYPVDWGMPSQRRFVLSIKLPEEYTVEDPPKTATISLPNNGGQFAVGFQASENTFTFSHLISLKRSVYLSEEYPYLKELYNQIILSEKSEMTFKKKI